MNLAQFILNIIIFFFSVILHECSHGWVAFKLGDTTAKNAGRLTLNPQKHIDPVGTIGLPIAILVINFFTNSSLIPFGFAKPVPVNFLNLHHPKRDMMWVGLSGPAANILLAIFFSFLLRLPLSEFYLSLVSFAIVINLVLAVFNMIPIPPLDGSRFIMGLLPNKYAYFYSKLEPYGLIVVIALLSVGVLHKFIIPLVAILAYYLGLR